MTSSSDPTLRRIPRSRCPAGAALLLALLLAPLLLPALPAQAASQEVPPELTLGEALSIAEVRSPAFGRLENALEREEIVAQRDFRTTFLPQPSGGMTFQGSRFRRYTAEDFDGSLLADPYFTVGQNSTSSQSVNLTMTVFSGASLMQYRAGRAAAGATRVSIESQRTALRSALTTLFYRVVQADERVALEREGLERARADLEAAEARFDAGRVDREQVLVAERALLRRERALEVETGNARKLRIDLLEQMGVGEEVPFVPVGDLPDPFDPDFIDEEELVADALAGSPRIRQAESAFESSVAGARASRAARWPTLSASAGFSRTRTAADYGSILELNPRNWGYTARVQMSVPFPFLNFSQNASLALSGIQLREAREEALWERILLENDLRKGLIDLRAAYGAVLLQEREVELARELLEILEARLRAGQEIEYDRLESAGDAAAAAERTFFATRIAFQNQVLALEQLVGREIRP